MIPPNVYIKITERNMNKMKNTFVKTLYTFFTLFSLLSLSSFSSDTVHSEAFFPEKIFLSDYDIIPCVKDQGNTRNCWAYTTFAAMESDLLKKNIHADFSENFLAYRTYYGIHTSFHTTGNLEYYNNGGDQYKASAILNAGHGLVSEKEAPINSTITQLGKIKNRQTHTHSDFLTRDINYLAPWLSPRFSYSTEQLKNIIIGKNDFHTKDINADEYTNTILKTAAPVICTCIFENKYFNPETNSLYCNIQPKFAGNTNEHSVLLIGWDDNYSKNNFNKNLIPENDGAWCAWSSSSASEDGSGTGCILWISYEDTSLVDPVVYSSVEPNYYQNIYQYDDFGWATSLHRGGFIANDETDEHKGIMANVFRAKNNELISSVSFYTISENVEYTIDIWTNVNTYAKPANPENGEKSKCSTKGILEHSGYHIVDLAEKIPVDKDTCFSVVLSITDNNSDYIFPIEGSIRFEYESSVFASQLPEFSDLYINSNESFVYDNVSRWYDLKLVTINDVTMDTEEEIAALPYSSLRDRTKKYGLSVSVGNLCIKAFSEKLLFGDIDFDGAVNSNDLAALEEYILSPDKYFHNYIDLNSDNQFSIIDVTILKSLLASDYPYSDNDTVFDEIENKNKKISEDYDYEGFSILKTSDFYPQKLSG